MTENLSHAKEGQRKKREKYSKIPLKSKLIFYEKVLHQNASLRDVAESLGIKYSTAKTLVRNYKFIEEEKDEDMVQALVRDFEKGKRPRRRCSYQLIQDPGDSFSSTCRGQSGRPQKMPLIQKIEIVSSLIGCPQQ